MRPYNIIRTILPKTLAADNEQSIEGWINGLTGPDLDIYYSDQFKQAIQKQKDSMDGASLTAENYAKALRDAKTAQQELSVATSQVSFDTFMSKVDEADGKLDKIDETYSKLFNNDEEIGYEDYSSIYDSFKDVEGLDVSDYVKQLQAAGQNTKAVKGVMEDLIDDYLQCSGYLENLSEDTAALAAQELEEQGVVNGSTIVYDNLKGQLESVAIQKDYLTTHGRELGDATVEEIGDFWNLCEASEEAKYYLAQYLLAKIAANGTTIDSKEDIENVIALANAAYASSEAIAKLKNAEAMIEKYGDGKTPFASTTDMRMYDEAKKTLEDVTNGVFDFNFQVLRAADYMPETVKGTKSYSNAQKSAGDATNKTTEALKKQKEELEDVKSEWEKLFDAVAWFYDNQSDNIDKQIDKLNDANDALNDQKDTYDDILSVIDEVYQKQIDAIQERIDALDEANDEEEKALQLEKARQALEEARRKRNIRVYTKDSGYVWTIDTDAVKEAEDEYNSLVDEMKQDEIKKALEDQIEAINKLRDAFADIPNAYERALKEAKASQMLGSNWKIDILNPGDDLINSFKDQYTGVQGKIDANEAQIDSLEKEKEKIEDLKKLWEDAKNAYTNSQYEAKLNAFFGSDYEYQLLSNSAAWSAQAAKEYADTCSQIEELEKKIKELEETESSSSSSTSGGGGSSSGGSGSGKTLGEVSQVLTDVNTSVDNTTAKVSELESAMSSLIEAKDKLVSLVGSTVNDVSDVIDQSTSTITALQGQVGILSNNVTLVGEAIRRLVDSLGQLDSSSFNQFINALTGAEGGPNLISALEEVISKISGESGLIKELSFLNDKSDISNLINQFNASGVTNEEAVSLLTAIQAVNDSLYIKDDENCLYGKILKLEETVATVNSVAASFDTFKQKVIECEKEIDKLAEKIQQLADVEITVKYTVAEATGTAFTPKGYATGTASQKPKKAGDAYASGSGNWGLPADAPHSLVGELGPEIVVKICHSTK